MNDRGSTFRLVLAAGLVGVLAAFPTAETPHLDRTSSPDMRPVSRPTNEEDAAAKATARRVVPHGRLPVSFEPNRGQAPGEFTFLSRGRGYMLGLSAQSAVLTLNPRGDGGGSSSGPALADARAARSELEQTPGSGTSDRLTMRLIDSRGAAQAVGDAELPGKAHYLIGADPSQWRTHVPTYARVTYHGVYRGIDLVYYGNQGELEYDFIVAPGADPRDIRLEFNGAHTIEIDPAGDLVLHMDAGELRQRKPIVYQELAGARRAVDARYSLEDGRVVGVRVGRYDASLPLVIDPILIYSSYLSPPPPQDPTDPDFFAKVGQDIAVDPAGNAYITGYTSVNGYEIPATRRNAFVMKINPAGSAVLYSTYIGGAADDFGNAIAIDENGSAYVTGFTRSLDFPTLQPFDFTGDGIDAFIAKLTPDGSAFVYSTYLGSNVNVTSEQGHGIAVRNGNAYVVGETDGQNFPTTPGAFQATRPGAPVSGPHRAFVTQLAANGSSLVYSTYVGGTDGHDYGHDIALDATGNAYITGKASSSNFPTHNPAQTWVGPIYHDWAFVTKLNATGSAVVYSTYLGGHIGARDGVALRTSGEAIALDGVGNAYVTGSTSATNFPTTAGAFDRTCSYTQLDCVDGFVTKLDVTGSAWVYSTYLGGSASGSILESGTGVAVDAAGRAHVIGSTTSTDFPTVDAIQATPPSPGNLDAFVSVLNPVGSGLVYSTYLGGSSGDTGEAIVLDAAGNAYVIGEALSNDFPIVGGFQTTGGGSHVSVTGGYVAKISAIGCDYAIAPTTAAAPATGGGGTVTVTTTAGCSWGASSAVSWIGVTAGATGSGSVTYTVAPSASTNPRTGSLIVAGDTIIVTQAGSGGGGGCTNASDLDCDGLPNTWETQFGLAANAATAPNGAAHDPDGDGLTNAQEFAAGTHPRGFFTRYLAEGATSVFFDTRLAMVNPTGTVVTVQLRYLLGDGTVKSAPLAVSSLTRVTVDPRTVLGGGTAEFSTTIESDGVLVIDRTMSWDPATGYGAHAETAVAAPALTWYLAEGSTVGGFNLFYLLQNPNSVEARARVRFLRPSGAPLEKTYALPPHSRTNVWVNVEDFPGVGRALAATDVSAAIESTNGQPIIVERAMYLNLPGQTFGAGHGSAGVTASATRWFMAEGATGAFFDLFVLIANPGTTDAQVEATYLLPGGTVIVKPYTVVANSRFNIWVDLEDARLADTAVSTTVRSTNGVPVIVERAMWWPGTSAQWYEAHNSPGATATGMRWALAEGEVGGARGVDTYILVANTSSSSGAVKVTLLFEDGTSANRTFSVGGNSRFNVDARSQFPEALNRRFGAVVESLGTVPAEIVVERAMYWSAPGQRWAAGTNVLAAKLQ